MSTRRFAVAALVAALALPGVARGGGIAVDLSGAWTGTIKCKGTYNGAKDTFFLDPTIRITELGNGLGIKLDYGNANPEIYTALVSPDAKKPDKKGEFVLVYCSTDDVLGDNLDFDELGRMSFSVKPGQVKATFKGQTVFADDTFAPSGGAICKWKYTRTSVDPQGLPVACPINMLKAPGAQ